MKNITMLAGGLLALSLILAGCAQEKSGETTNEQSAAVTPDAGTRLISLDVEGMTCTGCETGIKMALKKIDGVKKVDASYADGSASVVVEDGTVPDEKIIEAIEKVGYSAKLK